MAACLAVTLSVSSSRMYLSLLSLPLPSSHYCISPPTPRLSRARMYQRKPAAGLSHRVSQPQATWRRRRGRGRDRRAPRASTVEILGCKMRLVRSPPLPSSPLTVATMPVMASFWRAYWRGPPRQ